MSEINVNQQLRRDAVTLASSFLGFSESEPSGNPVEDMLEAAEKIYQFLITEK